MPSQQKICYLVNQYPKISHTFIRREIAAIEKTGIPVIKVSIRKSIETLVDESDIQEQKITHYILQNSKLKLVLGMLIEILISPKMFFRGLIKTYTFARSSRDWLRPLIYLVEAYYVKRICKTNHITHLHAHFGTNPAAVACLTRAIGGPSYSFTVHGPDEFDSPIAYGLNQKIADAKFVVAITSFCKSQLFRWANYDDWHKIKVVHCSLDKEMLEPPPKPVNRNGVFINIGRLSEQKGQMLLLQAMKILNDSGEKVCLKIVGDGDFRVPMENFIQSNHLEDSVFLLGWKSGKEIKELIDSSSALVLPSFAEGLPVVIMEAFGRARPVLTASIAGIPELVDHTCGALVTAGDVESLANEMRRLASRSTDDLNRMGSEGRDRVLKEHNADIEAKKILDFAADNN